MSSWEDRNFFPAGRITQYKLIIIFTYRKTGNGDSINRLDHDCFESLVKVFRWTENGIDQIGWGHIFSFRRKVRPQGDPRFSGNGILNRKRSDSRTHRLHVWHHPIRSKSPDQKRSLPSSCCDNDLTVKSASPGRPLILNSWIDQYLLGEPPVCSIRIL